MGVGKEEFFSLVVLDLSLLYPRPEGRSMSSPCWGMGGVREDGGGFPVNSAVVDAL